MNNIHIQAIISLWQNKEPLQEHIFQYRAYDDTYAYDFNDIAQLLHYYNRFNDTSIQLGDVEKLLVLL